MAGCARVALRKVRSLDTKGVFWNRAGVESREQEGCMEKDERRDV